MSDAREAARRGDVTFLQSLDREELQSLTVHTNESLLAVAASSGAREAVEFLIASGSI